MWGEKVRQGLNFYLKLSFFAFLCDQHYKFLWGETVRRCGVLCYPHTLPSSVAFWPSSKHFCLQIWLNDISCKLFISRRNADTFRPNKSTLSWELYIDLVPPELSGSGRSHITTIVSMCGWIHLITYWKQICLKTSMDSLILGVLFLQYHSEMLAFRDLNQVREVLFGITANRFTVYFWRWSLTVDIQSVIGRGAFIQRGKSQFIVLSSGVKLSLNRSDSLGQMLIAKYVMLPEYREIGGV